MTAEEFKKELYKAKEIERIAKSNAIKLVESYISANREFDNNELIKVIADGIEYYAYVINCNTFDDGEIYYQFNSAKKDGTKSKNRFYLHSANIVNIFKNIYEHFLHR